MKELQNVLALPRSVEELIIKASNHLEETDVLVPEVLAEAIVTWTTNQTHCAAVQSKAILAQSFQTAYIQKQL